MAGVSFATWNSTRIQYGKFQITKQERSSSLPLGITISICGYNRPKRGTQLANQSSEWCKFSLGCFVNSSMLNRPRKLEIALFFASFFAFYEPVQTITKTTKSGFSLDGRRLSKWLLLRNISKGFSHSYVSQWFVGDTASVSSTRKTPFSGEKGCEFSNSISPFRFYDCSSYDKLCRNLRRNQGVFFP